MINDLDPLEIPKLLRYEDGDWVRATDYDALAAKLATCEKYRDAYAECDCEKGGADCNWIATPTPAMCCLGLTPEQCAHTPSSQCEGLVKQEGE